MCVCVCVCVCVCASTVPFNCIRVHVGFTAMDLTVACMTEVMWMFVLLDNSLLEMVFEYTLKFILDPVLILTSYSHSLIH